MWCPLVAAVLCVNLVYGSFNENCAPLNFQTDVDIETLMGMWIGVEEITHSREDSTQTRDEERNRSSSSCPVINLYDASHEMITTESPYRPGDYGYQQRNKPQGRQGQPWSVDTRPSSRSFKYLRLTWMENRKNIVFYLQYNNSAKGYWLSTIPFKGDPLDRTYNQFTGTVQVMKAVKDHLVLYFCERLPDSRQFTIVLARQRQQLNSQDLQGIHSLLRRRGLSVTNVKEVCNSVNGLRSNIPAVLVVMLLVILNSH